MVVFEHWHRWHNEDIVMCAIMRGTGYDAKGGDHYGLR